MPTLPRAIKSRLPGFLRWVLETGQRFGASITPNHFYSETPDIHELRRTTWWRKPLSMHGIQGSDTAEQIGFFRACCEPYREQIATSEIHDTACRENGEGGYGPIEAVFLYCFLRSQRPARIVQVGCGVTTAIMARAVRETPGYQPEIVCIEPYPTDNLKRLASQGSIRLVAEKAQLVPMEQFTWLGPDGFLFVDSTHTTRTGADCPQLILEVFPRLAAGCRVQVHDMTFPYDYGPGILDRYLFFGREQVLLYAFLLQNAHFTIEAALSMLHFTHAREMAELMPWYEPRKLVDGLGGEEGHFPSACYMRVIG